MADGAAERLYARLLGAWPKPVRERIGADLRETFRARLRERSTGRVRFLVREYAAIVASGLRMRASQRRMNKRRSPVMERLAQDIRFATRSIVRNPLFASIVVLVLALGIGANTAIFSVLNATLLRQVPAFEPERLVTIRESNPVKGWVQEVAAPANILDWESDVAAFEGVVAYTDPGSATLTGEGEPEVLRQVDVTGNWFDVLGVRPQLGRGFRPEETWNTSPPVIVLSDGFWTRRFGRDPEVVGRSFMIGGVSRQVVGVMPAGFAFPMHEIDFWAPHGWDPEWREMEFFRRAHWLNAIARLRPGVELEKANAELQTVVRRLQQDYPATNDAMGAVMIPLQQYLTAEMRAPLLLLQGAVLLLLLVACTNVGNLLLVRAAGRKREMAVRAALGAGRSRVASLVLSESLLLAVAGGIAGIAVGALTIRLLGGLLPAWLPADIVTIDGRVLAFAIAITLGAGMAFGLAPALRRAEIEPVLRDGGRAGSGSRHSLRVSNVLVVAEVAVALVLVLGAGLLLRSFGALQAVDPGFLTENRVTASITMPTLAGTRVDATTAFFDRVHEGLDGIPGVRGTALAASVPLADASFNGYTTDFVLREWEPGRFGAEVKHHIVSPDYFETLGIPIVDGRPLQATDGRDADPVVVVNEAFVRQFLPGENPLGRSVAFTRTPNEDTQWSRIVGVVADTRREGLRDDPRIEVYQTYWQEATGTMYAIVHASVPPAELIGRIRDVVREVNPDVPLARIATLDQIRSDALRGDRFLLVLIAGFATLAMLLAALGVYGVVSQTARRRTHEIGIRMALGARRADVLGMIVRQSLATVGVGILLGTIGGLAFTRLMRSVLYGVPPTDPVTFTIVPALLAIVALVATLLPTLSATRIEPTLALRE